MEGASQKYRWRIGTEIQRSLFSAQALRSERFLLPFRRPQHPAQSNVTLPASSTVSNTSVLPRWPFTRHDAREHCKNQEVVRHSPGTSNGALRLKIIMMHSKMIATSLSARQSAALELRRLIPRAPGITQPFSGQVLWLKVSPLPLQSLTDLIRVSPPVPKQR